MPTRELAEKWAREPLLKRVLDAHVGTVKVGETTFLPIVVSRATAGAHYTADLEVIGPDGKIALSRPSCCSGTASGTVAALEPMVEMVLAADRPPGLYTA